MLGDLVLWDMEKERNWTHLHDTQEYMSSESKVWNVQGQCLKLLEGSTRKWHACFKTEHFHPPEDTTKQNGEPQTSNRDIHCNVWKRVVSEHTKNSLDRSKNFKQAETWRVLGMWGGSKGAPLSSRMNGNPNSYKHKRRSYNGNKLDTPPIFSHYDGRHQNQRFGVSGGCGPLAP